MPYELGDEPAVPVWSAGPYRAPLRGAIIDAKEHSKFAIMPVLGYHMAAAITAAAGAVTSATVVPIPSRRLATVRRGYDVVTDLARFAAAALRPCGLSIEIVEALHLTRIISDQGSLSGRQRRRNLHGAMHADSLDSDRVIIVDDVVTTGSTVAEAARALTADNIRPTAVASVATTAEQWKWRSPGALA